MRDTLKDKNYFVDFLFKLENLDKETEVMISNGTVAIDRIIPVRLNMIQSLIRRMKAKYSVGFPIGSLLEEYNQALDLIAQYWAGNCKFVGKRNEVLDQYSLGNYDTILWMLSLGYLLNVPEDRFMKLVNTIDKDCVKDKLYEFIIAAKIKSRAKISEESYKYGFILFGSIREAISTDDLAIATNLIRIYLEKEWYKEHKKQGGFENHNNNHDTYSGYWSFEAAAVVKIMGLDDSSFINNQYYPKDLVHFNNN